MKLLTILALVSTQCFAGLTGHNCTDNHGGVSFIDDGKPWRDSGSETCPWTVPDNNGDGHVNWNDAVTLMELHDYNQLFQARIQAQANPLYQSNEIGSNNSNANSQSRSNSNATNRNTNSASNTSNLSNISNNTNINQQTQEQLQAQGILVFP